MNKAIINIKSDKSLKESAEKYAKDIGLSLSDLVNLSLRYVVTTRSVVLDTRPTPNAETDQILKEALLDIKKKKNLSPKFKDTKSAFKWLRKQSKV